MGDTNAMKTFANVHRPVMYYRFLTGSRREDTPLAAIGDKMKDTSQGDRVVFQSSRQPGGSL